MATSLSISRIMQKKFCLSELKVNVFIIFSSCSKNGESEVHENFVKRDVYKTGAGYSGYPAYSGSRGLSSSNSGSGSNYIATSQPTYYSGKSSLGSGSRSKTSYYSSTSSSSSSSSGGSGSGYGSGFKIPLPSHSTYFSSGGPGYGSGHGSGHESGYESNHGSGSNRRYSPSPSQATYYSSGLSSGQSRSDLGSGYKVHIPSQSTSYSSSSSWSSGHGSSGSGEHEHGVKLASFESLGEQRDKKVCTTKPKTILNASMKCSIVSNSCNVQCLNNYQLPNGETKTKMICKDGVWSLENLELTEKVACERKKSPTKTKMLKFFEQYNYFLHSNLHAGLPTQWNMH